MQAGGRQGGSEWGHRGDTLPDPLSWAGTEPGSPHRLLWPQGCVTPGRCPLLGTGICTATAMGTWQLYVSALDGTTKVWPQGVPTDTFMPRSSRASAVHTRQQCPCGATCPAAVGTVAGAWHCPQLRAAAAVPIVNGGLAATASSPAPQGEVY